MNKRPVIGITLDWAAGKQGCFSRRPHYALRVDYFAAVYAAGGLPVAIPHIETALSAYLDTIDGLLAPGGDFPFPESWYESGASPYLASVSQRAAFDARLIEAAVNRDLPLLGICAGMQALGAVFGCRLHGDIRRAVTSEIEHRHPQPAHYSHPVRIIPDTRLRAIIGADEIGVNSAHREMISRTAAGVTVNAVAPDGVIEGIEIAGRHFALGVEWHPEYFIEDNSPHLALLKAFVDAARGFFNYV